MCKDIKANSNHADEHVIVPCVAIKPRQAYSYRAERAEIATQRLFLFVGNPHKSDLGSLAGL